MATYAQPLAGQAGSTDDRAEGWTRYRVSILAICVFGWAFDIFESTIPQLVTPLLIQEWQITPATIGLVTTVGRWVGLSGFFIFPVLADLYGRKSILMATILGYSLLTGFTGLAQNWQQLLVASSLTRVALSGENPVGIVMVAETAPTKWRATALGGLVGGYPFGYMLAALAGLLVVPTFGWRALYFLGVLPGLLVFFARRGLQESPRFERVTTAMIGEGIKARLDIIGPFRKYPREMIVGTLLNFFYLFTWAGWSAWMPQFLASEKKLGFQMAATYLTIWMAVAIAAYWLCGYLCDRFGRRIVIPLFVLPATALLLFIGNLSDPTSLFVTGLVLNFLITGSFGAGLGYASELFPTAMRGTASGAIFLIAGIFSSLSPAIMGYYATYQTIAAGLPWLALSFFMVAPIFLFFARETTGKQLADFAPTTA
ncbi:MAG: MFS transporter [Chloroflexota bacterium]